MGINLVPRAGENRNVKIGSINPWLEAGAGGRASDSWDIATSSGTGSNYSKGTGCTLTRLGSMSSWGGRRGDRRRRPFVSMGRV